MAQEPLLRLGPLSHRIYLVTRYRELESGSIEAIAKQDVTDQVGAVLAELAAAGLELCPVALEGELVESNPDDHSASRRLDVLKQEAPHLLAPSRPLEPGSHDA
jgi:hypothetical protein